MSFRSVDVFRVWKYNLPYLALETEMEINNLPKHVDDKLTMQ